MLTFVCRQIDMHAHTRAHTNSHTLTCSLTHTHSHITFKHHVHTHTINCHALTTHTDITRFLVQFALVRFKLASGFASWHLLQSVRLVRCYYAIDRSVRVVRCEFAFECVDWVDLHLGGLTVTPKFLNVLKQANSDLSAPRVTGKHKASFRMVSVSI